MYNSPMYYPNPAIQNAQQRLQMLEAQYPQYANPNQPYVTQQQSTMQSPIQQIIKGRPVSNEEEANAAMIDFDGSLFVFPDKAHGKIYTKQLGLDGNIVFLKYSIDSQAATQPVKEEKPQIEYATKEELSKAVTEMRAYLSQQLDQLTSPKEVQA